MLATWTGVLKDGHVCVRICPVKSKHTGTGTSQRVQYATTTVSTGLCGNY
jgi:hypothetical protein